ncbi:hypothetical protein [Rarobacter incanus]|uniref:Cobalamin-independent methionine synthase catalytic subunit n=1 Tax=Rarobacter incanus TaxID=153494 RepID=A0A542SN72_9MICO|nr:hypothetical protein [Rarobacter incanus]TQK76073.1 hypothetical protein FB389_0731 [Rarobacter incanus]
MIALTGTGPLWGTDPLAAQLRILDDLSRGRAGQGIGIPFEAQLRGTGPANVASTARACALLDQLPTELGPHGWKMADRPGRDVRAAMREVERQREATIIALAGYRGRFSVAATGPVTLASRLYLGRGDLAVSDFAAIEAVAHSLAEGIALHIDSLREYAPGIDALTLVMDESMLGAAMAGTIPNFSGMSRIRRVPREVIRAVLAIVRDRIGADVVVNLGPVVAGIETVCEVGGMAVGLNAGRYDARRWEMIAQAVESGIRLWWAVSAPARSQCAGAPVSATADLLWRPWRAVGLTGAQLANTGLIAKDLALATTAEEVGAQLSTLVDVAAELSDRADS